MSPKQQREKVYQAFAYFLAEDEVLYPFKTKLFKLLFFTDFVHYEKYGRAVTGLDYYAWENGPVPKEVWHDWENSAPEFIEHFYIKRIKIGAEKTAQTLNPRFKFDRKYFSNSELEIMKSLAKKHFKDSGAKMSEISHLETQPWSEVRNVRKQPDAHIPYELALFRKMTDQDQKVLAHARMNESILKNFSQ